MSNDVGATCCACFCKRGWLRHKESLQPPWLMPHSCRTHVLYIVDSLPCSHCPGSPLCVSACKVLWLTLARPHQSFALQIALLVLKKAVTQIKPVALATATTTWKDGEQITVVGWGDTEKSNQGSDDLL